MNGRKGTVKLSLVGTEEMAQQLGMCTDVVKDLSLLSNTNTV